MKSPESPKRSNLLPIATPIRLCIYLKVLVREPSRRVIWATCALVTFILLAIAVHLDPVKLGDKRLLSGLHYGMGWRLSRTMVAVNKLGNPFFIYPVTCLLALLRLYRKDVRNAAFIALAMGGTAVLNVGLRAIFGRERPHLWPSLLPNHSYIYSFPSGHASIVCALTLTTILVYGLRRRWAIALWVLVLLVGFTTLGLGSHFLTDVVGGWMLAIAWVLGLRIAFDHIPAPNT